MSLTINFNSLPYGWSASDRGNSDIELCRNLDLWVKEVSGSDEYKWRMDAAEVIEEWDLYKEGVLDLSCLELTSLPDAIGTLIFPKELDLSCNHLSNLPNTFYQLTELEWLNLEQNQFDCLPDAFSGLVSLGTLILEGNLFTDYPDTINKLPSLKEFHIKYNPFRDYSTAFMRLPVNQRNFHNDLQLWAEMTGYDEYVERRQAVDRIKCSINFNVNILFLGDLPLKSLPNMIGDLTTLEGIHLNATHEIHFPDTMVNLTALEVLDFGKGHPYNKLSPAEAIDSILTLQALDAELDL